MPNKTKEKDIIDMQYEIFEDMFITLLDFPSMRYMMKKLIESRERIDQTQLDIKLKRLELEILQKEDK